MKHALGQLLFPSEPGWCLLCAGLWGGVLALRWGDGFWMVWSGLSIGSNVEAFLAGGRVRP